MTQLQSCSARFRDKTSRPSAVHSQWTWNEQTLFTGDLDDFWSDSDILSLVARYPARGVRRCAPLLRLKWWIQFRCVGPGGGFRTYAIGTSDGRSAIATNCSSDGVDPFGVIALWNHNSYLGSRLRIRIQPTQPSDEFTSSSWTASSVGKKARKHVSSK